MLLNKNFNFHAENLFERKGLLGYCWQEWGGGSRFGARSLRRQVGKTAKLTVLEFANVFINQVDGRGRKAVSRRKELA